MPLPKGFVFTKESREKMSQSGKGRIFTDEHKANLSKPKTKKRPPFTEEHKRKLSEARKKRPLKEKTVKLKLPRVYSKRPYSTGKHNVSNRPEVKEKISLSKMGSKNPNWKGGVTPKNTAIRQSTEYKDWRIKVFQRDNYTCQECGSRGVTLHADHIKPFAYYPELRLVIENGRTLCVPCHQETETYGWKKSDYQLNEKI